MLDLRQSKHWGNFIARKGWLSFPLENGDIAFIKKLGIFGSIIKIQRPSNYPTNNDIQKLLKFKPLFIKIEPSLDTKGVLPDKFNFMVDTWPLIPTKTRIITLDKDIEEILANSTKDVRQSLKKTKIKVNLYKGTDSQINKRLLSFSKGYNLMAKKQKIGGKGSKELIELKDSFGDKFYLFEGEYNGKTNSGAIVLGAGKDNAFYMFAYTNSIGRKTYGSYKVLFEVIKKLKEDGYKTFDLEGVEDKRFPKETGRWGGFTIFKNKWDGKTVTYSKPYIIYFNKILKAVFIFSTIGENAIDGVANSAKENAHVDYVKTMIRARKGRSK